MPRISGVLRAVYFVQGILGLARLALTYFFKDELQLDPVRVSPRPARASATNRRSGSADGRRCRAWRWQCM